MKLNKWFLIIVIGIIIIPILLATIFYFINFHDQVLSKDLTIWGTFGDFWGGILNPLISLASLIILVYVTIQLSIYTNNHEIKLHYFKKREQVIHALSLSSIQLNLSNHKLIELAKESQEQGYDKFDEGYQTLQKFYFETLEYYYYMQDLPKSYGVYFSEYDFKCKEFLNAQNLMKISFEKIYDCKKAFKDKKPINFIELLQTIIDSYQASNIVFDALHSHVNKGLN